tara:strand:- start:30 stop:497 length:468 start_codon:yes stop_codon:yes gene_type:complete
MRETPFQNPRGGYFTMDDRGRLVAEKQHNPNNVHIGERYYSRQGPMGNPRLAGVDFGNRRPMYDKNGKLIQQRPVLKDTSTVPVPIMDYVGSMTAMAGKKTGKRPPLAMVPGNVVAPNVPEHTGHSNDMFKEDPYRSYNSGYRYNAHGLQPLYFG